MYWPRLKLTKEEKKWCAKYYEPGGFPGVQHRWYPGVLELNEFKRNPIFSFNTARRSRVFALTMAGDLHEFRISLEDVTGEQYTPNPIEPALLLGGDVHDVQSSWADGPPNGNAIEVYGWRGGWARSTTPQPFIQEPNIVLAPNQTLTVRGEQTRPPQVITTPEEEQPPLDILTIAPYRIDLVIHVWEFPGMDGGAL